MIHIKGKIYIFFYFILFVHHNLRAYINNYFIFYTIIKHNFIFVFLSPLSLFFLFENNNKRKQNKTHNLYI